MIMNNGYKQGETLIFDHLHRRSKKSDGVKTYPHEILQCREGFTRQIYEFMTSPVVIIYGQTVQERVLRHMQIEHTIFPLWDRADGVFLVLFHEKSFSNAEPGHKIRRIGLFASHPQRLFYKPQDSPIAQMQDKINWHCHGNGTRRHTRNREVLQQEGMAIQQCDDIEVVCTNRHRHSVG